LTTLIDDMIVRFGRLAIGARMARPKSANDIVERQRLSNDKDRLRARYSYQGSILGALVHQKPRLRPQYPPPPPNSKTRTTIISINSMAMLH
jgi:hypothetical protein